MQQNALVLCYFDLHAARLSDVGRSQRVGSARRDAETLMHRFLIALEKSRETKGCSEDDSPPLEALIGTA